MYDQHAATTSSEKPFSWLDFGQLWELVKTSGDHCAKAELIRRQMEHWESMEQNNAANNTTA